VVALATAVLTRPSVGYALAAALSLVLAFAVYRLPVVSLSALVVVTLGPRLFEMTGGPFQDVNLLLGKLSLSDAIMFAMMLAVALKAAVSFTKPRRLLGALPLAVCLSMLFAWIPVEVLRNVDVYGIHTVGQFRFSYLVLVTPVYAAMFLRSSRQRRRFCVFLLVFSVGVTLAAVPVIGYLKGWGIGPHSRFFPAWVSLGLMYGWIAMLLMSERGVLRTPKWVARGLGFPVAAMVVFDSHRSVWLAGLVLVVYLLVAGRVSAALRARIIALAAVVVAAFSATASIRGLGLWSYVESRGTAIFNPTADPTASWRISIWEANFARWRQHPLAGEGFGAYYQANALQGLPETMQPHNYYVQTLVVMGAIGLVLLMAVVIVAAVTFLRALRRQGSADRRSLDGTLATLGLGILLSALAFCSAYAIDPYSCLWVGVGLAAALGSQGISVSPVAEPLAAQRSMRSVTSPARAVASREKRLP
jgi:O-antigen ligase